MLAGRPPWLAALLWLVTGLAAAQERPIVPATPTPGPAAPGPAVPGPAPTGPAAPVVPAVPAAAATLGRQLEALRGELRAGKEALSPLADAVDLTAAEAWLAASPLERFRERAADAALNDAERASWQQAADSETAAAERVRGALDRAALGLEGPMRLDEALARVETMLAPATAEDEDQRPPSVIDRELASLGARRAQASLELDQRRETLARLEEQLRGQAATLDQLRREREQELANAPPAAPGGAAESAADAAQRERDSLERRVDARVIAAQLDAQSLPLRIERLRLEVRTHELEVQWLGVRLAHVQAELEQRTSDELRELTAGLQRLIAREPDAEQRFATEIAALRAQTDRIAASQSRTRELQREREEYIAIESDLKRKLENVEKRLQVGGLTETLGGLFLEEQRRVRALGDKLYALTALERELAQSQLRAIGLREQLDALPEPDAGIADDSAQSQIDALEYRVATGLVQSEEQLAEELQLMEAPLRSIVGLVDQLEQIFRQMLLWWPSHEPMSLEWARAVPAALVASLDPASWDRTKAAVREVTVGSPALNLVTLLAVVLLWRAGRQTGSRLRDLAEQTRHRFTDNMTLTLKAIGWSVLCAAPVPVLLMSLAYRLERLQETGPGVAVLAMVLSSTAIWWLAAHLLALLISRNGVGTVHFGWNTVILERLRRNLPWYLPTQFVLTIGIALAFGHPSDVVFDVLGRGALITAAVLTAWLLWRVFAPGLAPFSDRQRWLIRSGSVLYMAALVILAVAGYLLTVSELFIRTIDTVIVACLVGLGYCLAARALILSETRLRIRRLQEQRAKAAESGGADGESVELPEPHLSMEDINLQTRTLVKVVAGGAVVVTLFWVWADILPALSWLDRVTLWERTVAVSATETVTSRISLQNALLALFLGALSIMASRNLPGLVEILLVYSTRMDGAGRYTVTTLLRYAILMAAVISVFSLIGLRWSELQWLAAALTLGLGFGLQEVVANFVSGLIMLFERPVRVGDTITIGEYSGVVARIRTRATTIVDGDNREILVPNKSFITERLVNWTLSDTTTRIVLPVGVSYEADVDLVLATLEEIAKKHPLVLGEPAPQALFLAFGDSALKFELRVYVAQLRDRLDTTSQLHRTIVKVFRERGIGIALPQMDLHVRDAEPVGPSPAQAAGAPQPKAAPSYST